MDYQRINKLLDKYWECATSVEEERELRRFFSSAVIPPDLLPYKAWFVSHEADAGGMQIPVKFKKTKK